jgi:hypothetical protein
VLLYNAWVQAWRDVAREEEQNTSVVVADPWGDSKWKISHPYCGNCKDCAAMHSGRSLFSFLCKEFPILMYGIFFEAEDSDSKSLRNIS